MRRAILAVAVAALALVTGGYGGSDQRPVRIGVLADCGGYLGPLYGPTLASAELPLLARGGDLVGVKPEDGVRGARVAGRPVELVLACTAVFDFALLVEEARRLVELEHVDAVVGPVGDGDGLVLREVARRYPDVAFVGPLSDPPELTLHDPAPNVYRFAADGTTAVAGLGAHAYHKLGWRRAAVVLDDTAPGWANSDGFAAEFCALGGTIEARVSALSWEPDGSDVAKVPEDVDGVAVMVSPYTGGVGGLISALSQRQEDPPRSLVLGPGYVLVPEAVAALPPAMDGVVAATPLPPEADSPTMAAHVDRFAAAFPTLPRELATGPVILPYYDAMEALMLALEATGGDVGADGARLREALARVEADFPDGHVRLDANRQGIRDVTLVRVAHENGQGVLRTVRNVPDAEQTYGGILASAPPPSSAGLPCRNATPPPWAAAP